MVKTRLIGAIFTLCLCGFAASIYAQDDVEYSKQLEIAKKFTNADKGREALKILKPLLLTHSNFDVYLLTAQAYADSDEPILALRYYNLALEISKDAEERHVALFGVGKMRFWLGQYVRAEQVYKLLLSERLNKEDHELALAGLVKSLAYQDRTRTAYSLIPPDLVFTTPEMVVAASQASLWSDWPDIAEEIMGDYQHILDKLDPWSALGQDIRDVAWQADLATSPNVITPTFFYASDTDDFIIRHSTLDYTHYWSQIYQTSVGVEHLLYTQPVQPGSPLSANGIYLGQTWRPTRDLIFTGRVEPTNYASWHPVLWSLGGRYRPNDYIGFNLLGFREIVEAFPALANRIADNQYSAGVTLYPVPYITVDASVNNLQFNDSNVRNGYYASIQALLLTDLGLYGILQTRGFTDKFQTPNYFSPSRYTSETAILRLSRRLGATWQYYIDGGVGQQSITPQGSPAGKSPTNQWGLGISGPISSWLIFSAYYAQTTQASAFTNSATYKYQYGAASLNFLF
ncbi:MAG: tetratricopeptide repeat protein [Gammaproteobacteria bacterium]